MKYLPAYKSTTKPLVLPSIYDQLRIKFCCVILSTAAAHRTYEYASSTNNNKAIFDDMFQIEIGFISKQSIVKALSML